MSWSEEWKGMGEFEKATSRLCERQKCNLENAVAMSSANWGDDHCNKSILEKRDVVAAVRMIQRKLPASDRVFLEIY
jgi:hypothetical protein